MTKKTFEFVAQAIKDSIFIDEKTKLLCLDSYIIDSFLSYFKKENKNFDEKRFLEACNLEWEYLEKINGEKIKFKLRIKEEK